MTSTQEDIEFLQAQLEGLQQCYEWCLKEGLDPQTWRAGMRVILSANGVAAGGKRLTELMTKHGGCLQFLRDPPGADLSVSTQEESRESVRQAMARLSAVVDYQTAEVNAGEAAAVTIISDSDPDVTGWTKDHWAIVKCLAKEPYPRMIQQDIASEIGRSVGTVKSLMPDLEKSDLIYYPDKERKGCRITPKGISVWDMYRSKLPASWQL